MVGGVSPETFWAIKKHWNNKFYYTVASCWFSLWVLYYDARIHEHQVWNSKVHILDARILNTNQTGRQKFQKRKTTKFLSVNLKFLPSSYIRLLYWLYETLRNTVCLVYRRREGNNEDANCVSLFFEFNPVSCDAYKQVSS